MQTNLTRSELIIALLIACYGGLIGAAMALLYAFARSA
jgi:hypothetical protein